MNEDIETWPQEYNHPPLPHSKTKKLKVSLTWKKTCIYRWCILSRTTVIPHMVHQGDAPVYYLHVILLIWTILTRPTEVMEHGQARENV